MKYELDLRGNFFLKREEFNRRMRKAENYLFSLGMNDLAEEIGRINATLYLAKIHCISEKLGYDPRAMFIGAPDFTFQTSPQKFYRSVPEGGKIIWGDGKYDFVPGDMEFDFCGMLVGTVENAPSLEEIIDAIYEMKAEERNLKIDGRKVDLKNFSPSSHFLNIYEVQNHKTLNLSKRVAILHTSSDEMRDQLLDFVRERSEEILTPFDKSCILVGSDAREYIKRCGYASNFSKRKRKLLYKKIFGGKIIANQNHYELTGPNEAIIGCNLIKKEGEVFALTLNGSFSYLIRGRKNLSPEKIEKIGLNGGPIERWVYNELRRAIFLEIREFLSSRRC